jgi:hypothetical protein
MAWMVSVLETVMGEEYCVDDVVGAEPSVV